MELPPPWSFTSIVIVGRVASRHDDRCADDAHRGKDTDERDPPARAARPGPSLERRGRSRLRPRRRDARWTRPGTPARLSSAAGTLCPASARTRRGASRQEVVGIPRRSAPLVQRRVERRPARDVGPSLLDPTSEPLPLGEQRLVRHLDSRRAGPWSRSNARKRCRPSWSITDSIVTTSTSIARISDAETRRRPQVSCSVIVTRRRNSCRVASCSSRDIGGTGRRRAG